MSDDNLLGTACCMPSRAFFALLAATFILYTAGSLFYWVVIIFIGEAKLTPTSTCHGMRCGETITCHGMLEATYHLHQVYVIVFGLICGLWGFSGTFFRRSDHVFNFACFLAGLAGVYLLTFIMDTTYTVACDAYPYHVIEEVLLAWLWNLPITEQRKVDIRYMHWYPREYVDGLTRRQVGRLYFLYALACIGLYAYCAVEAFRLASRMHYGVLGLGANYSIEGWRQRLFLRYDLQDAAYRTMDAAAERICTTEDYGYPVRPWKWYGRPRPGPRGMRNMPIGPDAYDDYYEDEFWGLPARHVML